MNAPLAISYEADVTILSLNTAANHARLALRCAESILCDLDELAGSSRDEQQLVARHGLRALNEAFDLTLALLTTTAAVACDISADDREPSLHFSVEAFIAALAAKMPPRAPHTKSISQCPPSITELVTLRCSSPESVYSFDSASPTSISASVSSQSGDSPHTSDTSCSTTPRVLKHSSSMPALRSAVSRRLESVLSPF